MRNDWKWRSTIDAVARRLSCVSVGHERSLVRVSCKEEYGACEEESLVERKACQLLDERCESSVAQNIQRHGLDGSMHRTSTRKITTALRAHNTTNSALILGIKQCGPEHWMSHSGWACAPAYEEPQETLESYPQDFRLP